MPEFRDVIVRIGSGCEHCKVFRVALATLIIPNSLQLVEICYTIVEGIRTI